METLAFQTQTGRVLDLVIHSLYTTREIFLRELISNASDALDRRRFDALNHPELLEEEGDPEIRLQVDPESRTLTVSDNGIGMSRQEVNDHLGTIARSGTRELLERLAAEPGRGAPLDLIGRFGVGFYSCFMVADRVTVVTRRAGEASGTRWESNGETSYTLEEAAGVPRGTSVILSLAPVDADRGIEDYTDRWVLSRIVKRYSDFVPHPIVYVGPEATDAEAAQPPAPRVLNSRKPIWTRPEADVTAEEYTEFYKHLAHAWDEPSMRMSFRAEGRSEYAALLFVPSEAPPDLHYHAAPFGLQLYAQRVLIVDSCRELVPRYLRFLKGIVDAADLPLNVSRDALQEAHQLTQIRRWLTRKVLEHLGRLAKESPAKFLAFWQRFGRALKEGVSDDYDNRDRLLPLLRFESSADATALTSLDEYVSRMKPDQGGIYYVTAETRAIAERSPHLEEFGARGYEVLYLTDPVDEVLVQALSQYQDHRLRSVAKGKVELGTEEERAAARRELEEQTAAFAPLIDFLGTRLSQTVRAVRLSRRLTTSPACLSGEEYDSSPQVERLLLRGKGGGAAQRRILELNARHPLIRAMLDRARQDSSDPQLAASADLVLGCALLAEGSELTDPVTFVARVTALMTEGFEQLRSPAAV